MSENSNKLISKYTDKISKLALYYEPERMAHLIYFFIKQDRDCIFILDPQKSLKELKQYLIVEHGWDLFILHNCFETLKELTKYCIFPLDLKK
jgi:hypothetical protein